MRRVASIIGFLCLLVMLFAGIFYYAHFRDVRRAQNQIKMAPAVTIYTDLPQGTLSLLDKLFFEKYGMHLSVKTSSLQTLAAQKNAEAPDVYILSQGGLLELETEGRLFPYVSDKTDVVLNQYKDERGYWTGVWINPAVFAVNTDFAFSHPAFRYTWDEVLSRQSVRIVMTDFASSDYAADGLFSLIEHFGWVGGFDRLRHSASHIVQYGKYLTTPAHMAAMDKCDIGISGYDEAERVRQEGLPIRVIFPEDGTYFYLYGAALGKRETEKGEIFIDWLLSENSTIPALSEGGYHFIHVNAARFPEDDAKKQLSLWPLRKIYAEDGKKELIDTWIQEIRFGKGMTS